MTASQSMIDRLRRMCGETNSQTYSDADLQSYIEAYPIIKEEAYEEEIIGYATLNAIEYPIVDYDIHLAAADIWEEKQAALADHGSWDVSGPGGGFQKSQQFDQYDVKIRYHKSCRHAKSVAIKSYQGDMEYRYDRDSNLL